MSAAQPPRKFKRVTGLRWMQWGFPDKCYRGYASINQDVGFVDKRRYERQRRIYERHRNLRY